jgi:hypothetical protein
VVLLFSCPASGKVVFNIDIQPDTYGNAYKGGPAVYDDGINNWYAHLVYPGTDWFPFYSYNARIIPSQGKPADATHGVRILTGWDGYSDTDPGTFGIQPPWMPEYFDDDPNDNALMGDGAQIPSIGWDFKYCGYLFYGDNASAGVFNVYVYSNIPTEYRWAWENDSNGWRALAGYQGGVWDPCNPVYTEGENYLVYEGINLDSGSRPGYEWAALFFRTPFLEPDPGALSAIQLVYEGSPIDPYDPNGDPNFGTTIDPTWYTWAHDYDSSRGPYADVHQIAWTQQGEWLQYDIFADGDGNEGYYDVHVGLESPFTDANCGVSLDSGPVHVVSAYSHSDPCNPVDPNNLWDGTTVDQYAGRWYISKEGHSLRLDVLSESAFNIWGMNFQWSSDQTDDCADLQERGETLAMDFNFDCIVNAADFGQFAADWLNCNDPEGCP